MHGNDPKTGRTRWPLRLLPALLPLALVACEGATESAPAGVAGEYRLTHANGEPLPATVVDRPGERLVAEDGALKLEADGDFTQAVGYLLESGGVASRSLSTLEGSYSVSGSRIELRVRGSGSRYRGTLDGGVVSYTVSGSDATVTLSFARG